MSFWIRKYKIELERLPLSVLSQSVVVILLCVGILTSILLLLPIQDTIKGQVYIYANGQPLSILATTSGSFHFHAAEQVPVIKGDVLATIDADVSPASLGMLEQLIYADLPDIDFTEWNSNKTRELTRSIADLGKEDFRNIKTELIGLLDQLKHLYVVTRASDPQDHIDLLDKAISIKSEQVESISTLNVSQNEILKIVKTQVRDDSILHNIGGLSEREYLETKKTYITNSSLLIENELRKQQLTREMISDEEEKFTLAQKHRSDVAELQLRIYDQLRLIRQQYEAFIQKYIIYAPSDGYVSLPYDIVDRESVNEGATIMFISSKPKTDTDAPTSEMYVDAVNAGKIEPLMTVRIALSEFDQKEFGFYETTVIAISDESQDGKYKVSLSCEYPLTTSYKDPDGMPIHIPLKDTYSGRGEVLIDKINLYTKISREIQFNRAKNGVAIVN